MMSFTDWWQALAAPLSRLLFGLCCGLLAANLIEALGVARNLSRLAAPLARAAHMGHTAAASFAVAFASPSAANAMLAEAHDAGSLSRKELLLANLFNSLPSYLVHLPTLVLLIVPVLGTPALTYAGLTLGAATLRTMATLLAGRLLLPPSRPEPEAPPQKTGPLLSRIRAAWPVAWKRFKRRVPRLLLFTIPIYCLMIWLHHAGWFGRLESWLAGQPFWSSWLSPQAVSIMALSLMAEVGASVSAAGAVLHTGGISTPDVVLALLIGNILSSPMRAIRHQFPAYAGYYRPGPALMLMLANQSLRAVSLCLMAVGYYLFTH